MPGASPACRDVPAQPVPTVADFFSHIPVERVDKVFVRSFSLAKKMMAACATTLVLTAALGSVSLYTNGKIISALQAIITDSQPGIYQMGRMAQCVGDIRADTVLHMLATREEKARYAAEIQQREGQFREIMAAYEKTITTQRDRELFTPIASRFDGWTAKLAKVLALSDASQTAEANALYANEARPAGLELLSAVDAESQFNKENGDNYAATATKTGADARLWTWAMLFLALGLGTSISAVIILGV